MKQKLALFAVAGVVSTSLFTVQSQPYYISGSALTPAWAPGTPANELTGGPTVYSLTQATATNAYHEFKVTGASWSDPAFPGGNVKIKGDANGTNTFYFFPGTTVDGWFPVANRIGYADPGNMAWEVAGDFTNPNWGSDPTAQLTLVGNGVFSLTYVVPAAGTHAFKFRSSGSWDVGIGTDISGGGDASVTTTQANQSVQFQLDLPNGRWLAGSPAPAPVTNYVVFSVDMSVELGLNRFNPASDAVYVSGSFNGWPGTGAGALVLTNDPTLNGNTNIYYGTNIVISLPSSSYAYKFTDNDPSLSGQNGYEPRGSDRTFHLLSTNGTILLPTVVFGDSVLSDYLDKDMWVTFTVNLTNAVTSTNSPSNINSPEGMNVEHAYDPVNDTVVINGNFLVGGWVNTWNPIALNGNVMTNNPPDSQILQFTYLAPKGSPVEVHYKYGMRYSANPSTNNILDNEAASFQDHVRNIRTTATGSYTMPLDTFGVQHAEPSFGQLNIGAPVAGKVPLTWLGRPGVQVQTSTNLVGGLWLTHIETDGTNWSAGSNSPEGLLSTTNWPATGSSLFFRLIKPN